MNITNNTLVDVTQDIIQEATEDYTLTLVLFSATALGFYATLTTFSREVDYIWSRPFSLPALLYILARYGNLIYQGLVLSLTFLPSWSGSSCNILAEVQGAIGFLPYVGTQGLLIVRAYSVIGGKKILSIVLVTGVLSTFALYLYDIITIPGCVSSFSSVTDAIEITINIITVCTDLLIFVICMWKVWGIWRLKRKDRIQSSNNLVSILFTQGITRCCFVVTITVIGVIVQWLTRSELVSEGYVLLQDVLSATLVADFTLNLRALNFAKIEASQMSLPSLRFSNVLQHMHQSILVEMATPEERNAEEEAEDHNHDHLSGSTDSDIQPTEV